MITVAHIEDHTFVLQSAENLGALEVSTFLSLVLYGISLSQCYTYFKRSSDDRLALKAFVTLLLILDTFHSFTAGHAIYLDTITRWDRAEPNSIPLSITVVLESVITFVVQCFFIHRIYQLSGRFLIAISCLALAILRFICAVMLSVESVQDVFRTPNGVFVQTYQWLITSGLTLGAATDLLIAAFMIYYLRKFLSPTNLQTTTEALNRVLRGSLQTGLLTSMTSVSVILCFQFMSNMIWYGVYVILAKLYALSLLVSLNARQRTKADIGGISALEFKNIPDDFTVVSLEAPPPFSPRDADNQWPEKVQKGQQLQR
ncbi:hypothetical protein BDN70DRAFT_877188 [Pholiota conissans]|uniref:DUF6534 domain-containing protein n=1 Tax=Pholiota conissans TaxID=109636 RepID=A0A9P5Z445_9AGAR|nr:hypothetical protein BDN70DRAFT_877188 [Pholiota conissans]